MLWKCCTQYVSKFRKLRGGHRTRKGQFSFQSQRKAMSKNAQTNIQLHSLHILVRLCSKSFKLGFNSMWTEKFQMYKLDLEKEKNRDQTANISWIMEKTKEFQKNINFCLIDYAKAFDCVHYNQLWKILKVMGVPDHLTYLLIKLYAGQEATVRTGHETTDWFQIGKGVSRRYIVTLLI